jgi:spore cortex formation protein SpoVR/YcgB (stage V sporulation)
LLENISSFLGVGRIKYTLEQIGVEKVDEVMEIVNSLSHKNVYRLQFNKMAEAEEAVFRDVFQKIQDKYRFIY